MPPAGLVAISIHPDDAVQGGLFDDVNVRFVTARFIGNWDYNGKLSADKAVLAIHAKMLDIDANTELENYWSMGRPKNLEPSPDGCFLVSTVEGGGGSLVQDTKGMLFLQSLIQCGFPDDALKAGKISSIDGLEAHIIRVADPTQRKGLAKNAAEGQPQREDMVLVVDNILALPGAKKAPPGAKTGGRGTGAKKGAGAAGAAGSQGAGSGSGAGAGSSTGSPGSEGIDIGGLATETLMTILGTAGNESGVPKKMLSPKAFPLMKKQPPEVSKAVMNTLFSDEFLKSLADAGMISYTDGQITLPG